MSDSDDRAGQQANPRQAQERRYSDKKRNMVTVRSLVGLFLWAVLLLVAFRFYGAVKFVILAGMGTAVLAAAVQPLADRMPGGQGVRAMLAMTVVLLTVAVVMGGVGMTVYPVIQQKVQQWPQIHQRADEGLQTFTRRIGMEDGVTVDELGKTAWQILTGGSSAGWLSNLIGGAIAAILGVIVVVVGAAYLLARPAGALSKPASRLLPPERQEPTRQAIEDLQPQFRWWLIGTLFSMGVIGVVFGLGYWIIGLEFALPLALFAALAQMVPTFGPLVTMLLSLLIAATQGPTQVVGVVVVYLVAQTLESYFLTPMVMKKAVKIPPIITLFTIILWGNIFGPAGLILAIPLDLTIWAFLKRHLVEEHQFQKERDGP